MMCNHDSESRSNSYRVRVGHAVVHVRGKSIEEAIALARRQLAEEMPRFYDVIRDLDPARFEVQRAA